MLYDFNNKPIDRPALELHAGEDPQNHKNTPSKTAIGSEQSGEVPPLRIFAETDFPSELKKRYQTDQDDNYRLQQYNFAVQCLLCLFTAGAFIAAFVYALIASQQRDAMNETLREAHIQNIAQQRAVLVVDSTPTVLEYGGIGIRVRNQGRMPAKIISYKLDYSQLIVPGSSFDRQTQGKPGHIVTVEEPLVILVSLPVIPPHTKFQAIRLELVMLYDDGFNETQRVSACFNPQPGTNEWLATCMWGEPIDLSKKLPTDVVIGESPAKQK